MDALKTYVVKIVYDPEQKREKSKHVALPGHLYLRRGESIIFTAKYTDVIIWIPNANVLFGSADENLIISLSDGEDSEPFTVIEDCKCDSEFPYAVYCGNGNDFAEGNTPPRMIIE